MADRAHLPEKVVELDDVQHYSTNERIKALSDGVFAIAMTLLAFTLIEKLQVDPHPTPAQFLSRFGPPLVVYAASFVVLGVYWISHAIQFHYVIRADRPLMVRTVMFLIFVSLVPFSASYLGSDTFDHLALLIYCANLALCGVFLAWMLLYATKDALMLHPVMDRRIFRALRAAYLTGPILYLIAFLVSFVNTMVAFAICVLVPVLTFFPNPFWGRFFARVVGNRAAAEEEEANERPERA